MSGPIDPWRFLDALLELDAGLPAPPPDLLPWLGRLNCSADLAAAMRDGCLGGARTAVAAATWRCWPRGEEIPGDVRAALEVLGVTVGW